MAFAPGWRRPGVAMSSSAAEPKVESASPSRFPRSSRGERVGEEFSFPKTARIRRRREFLSLQRRGRRRHTEHFVVIRSPSDGIASRLGITVSARVGNAVVRNRLKRFARELFRTNRRSFAPAQDLVVIAKPGASVLSHAQAATELSRALDLPGRH